MPRLVCPDLGAADQIRFAMRIEFAMQRQDQRAIFGDFQRLRCHADALLLDFGNFVEKVMRIDHHAIAR